MSLLPDLGTYLDTQQASLTLGTNLFLGRLPETPDTCVALFEYAGEMPENTMGGASMPVLVRPRVQALCRAATYANADTLSQLVFATFQNILQTTLSSTLYLRVDAIQSPFVLERDSSDRVIFCQNFAVVRPS